METKFELISQGDNTVTYDIGGGPMPAFSAFYAAGYPNDEDGGFVAIEHRTLEYFGTRLIPLAGVTVNGVTFTTVAAAVMAINALDFTVPVTDQIGNLAAHTDIKSLDVPTVTMPDPTNEGETITKVLALAEDIPVVPPVTRTNVTDMFSFSPAVLTALVERVDYGEGAPPFIDIRAVNETAGAEELQITVEFGFGSLYAFTPDNTDGNKTLYLPGNDGQLHAVTITPETYNEDGVPIAKSVITIPAEVQHFSGLTYTLGATQDTESSYYIDTNGVAHVFTAANTPIGNFSIPPGTTTILIEGVDVLLGNVRTIVFGSEYSATTQLPVFFCFAMPNLVRADISVFTNLTVIYGHFFQTCSNLRELRCGSLDASNIGPVNGFAFMTNGPDRVRRHATQALAGAWTAAFENTNLWTVIIDE